MSFSRSAAPARPLAGWWTRGGALAIDLLITGAVELALLLIVWLLSGSPRWTVGHAESLAFEVGLPVAVIYAPLLLARAGERNGQTIGKQAMGIRVIRADGLPLTFATALVREALGRQVPALLTSGLYVPVDYLWALWDPRSQALHDKVGRTFVVGATGSAPTASAAAPATAPPATATNDEPSPPEPIRGDWLPPVAPD
ncbi:MAG TPA: RDD family protein [Solirubrobacteraceae bacterium]